MSRSSRFLPGTTKHEAPVSDQAACSLPSGKRSDLPIGQRLRSLVRCLCVMLTGLCLSSQAVADNRARQREENLTRLSQMSGPERDQLKRNLQEFRELPAAEKERMRRLQRGLRSDAAAGGRLNRVLDAYYDWLKTLSPGQRSDLRNETDPVRRFRQVSDLLQRQETVDSGEQRRRRPGLTVEELAAVMPVLETALLQEGYLSPDRLVGKEGLARYSLILQAAYPPERREPNPAWLKPQLVDAMIAAIPNEEKRRQIGREQERRRVPRLMLGIYGGIQAEFRQRAEQIDPTKLEEFFVQMKGEQQDEVMRVAYGSQEMKLRQMYMRAHPDEFPAPPPQPAWLNQMLRSGGRGPGMGPPGHGNGGDSTGHPGDGEGLEPNDPRGPRRPGGLGPGGLGPGGQGPGGAPRPRPRGPRRPDGDGEPAN